MLKKMMFLIFSGFIMMNLSGCFLFVAGVAGGAGTAVWLSGKMTQEFHFSYQHTIDAANAALKSLNLPINKETQEDNITQIKSVYNDGREIWVDIRRVADDSTRVDIRVGLTEDKDVDNILLKKIQSYL